MNNALTHEESTFLLAWLRAHEEHQSEAAREIIRLTNTVRPYFVRRLERATDMNRAQRRRDLYSLDQDIKNRKRALFDSELISSCNICNSKHQEG